MLLCGNKFGPLLILLALLIQAGCQQSSHSEPEEPIVLVSVLPQAYFVERLAGARVKVEVMVPPGASPATFEPSLKQMKAASQARLYVTVGHPNFPFERTWLKRLTINNKHLSLVSCTPKGLKSGDPHIWVSPRIGLEMTDKICDALIELLPEHAQQLNRNREALLSEIASLDHELKQVLEPLKSKKFLVYHPAWGHFAKEYGLEQVPIEQGMKEPSTAALSRLIAMARREDIGLVFVQPQFSQEHAKVVAREIGGKVVEADPLARDWSQNLRRMAEQLRDNSEP